jgi:hypothetical protein
MSACPSVWGPERRFVVNHFVGSIKRLAWAKANGCPWEASTCAAIVRHGDIAVLKWAREHDCPWDACTCTYAAMGGHLEMLQWAREHSCPWNWQMCWSAVLHLPLPGSMELLRWAREHGAPWDAATRDLAASMGYTDDLPLPP